MRILVAGDFAPYRRIEEMIESEDYSFFDEVKEITDNMDYSIVNLEVPIVNGTAEPIVKTGPNLKCHPNTIDAIKYAGFNCATLANNHFYDYGEKGVLDTINAFKHNGIDHIGGGSNINEAEMILYKKYDTQTLAIINFCENEWSIATEKSGGSAPLNIVHNTRNIQEAKKNADFVLVIVHGGTEGYQLPTPRMKETYRFFIEQGADVVINHHQHCYSGYEEYQGKMIFYGLGNFCFDTNSKDDLWNKGYAVEIEFNKTGNTYKLLPYIQCAEKPTISFIKDSHDVYKHIDKLNTIINDDKILYEHFLDMAKNKMFLQFFEPYNNKYLKFLKAKGLVPSFLNRYKKNLILNLFRCEAHRDVMFELLKKN